MPRHIPPGKEDLWRAQAQADAEVTRLEKAIAKAEHTARELAAAFGPADSITEGADREVERLYAEHDRATAVANRVYDERMDGLSSWIDTDPTAPVCTDCHGAGNRPGTAGRDVADSCPGCRGWGRAPTEPIATWDEASGQWVNPATGQAVDLLGDPEPEEKSMPKPGTDRDQFLGLLREMDDEDLEHEKHNTGELQEMAEDDGDTERAARLAKDYADFQAEQQRRTKPAPTGKTLKIQRTGRWYDENPITSTNTTSTGGTGMSIGDAKQGMLGPIEKLNEALGLMQAGNAALEEAQTGLRQATEGSSQAEADQAHAQVDESKNKIDEAQQQIAQALGEFEGVAQRL